MQGPAFWGPHLPQGPLCTLGLLAPVLQPPTPLGKALAVPPALIQGPVQRVQLLLGREAQGVCPDLLQDVRRQDEAKYTVHNRAVCDVAVGTGKEASLAQRGQRLRWQVLCCGHRGLKTQPVSLTCFQTWNEDQSHPKSRSLLDSAHPIYHLLPCPHCPESCSALQPNQPHWAPY